jgi:hypothetical protein
MVCLTVALACRIPCSAARWWCVAMISRSDVYFRFHFVRRF